MSKYSKRVVAKIIALAESDEYSQAELARIVGITPDTFSDWKTRYPEFLDAYEKACERLTEKRLVECRKSLTKLINGYNAEETVTEYVNDDKGKPAVRFQRVVEKHIPPSLGAIIHYQSNKDPENWQNKQRLEHTGKDGEELQLRPLTDEELEFLKQGK